MIGVDLMKKLSKWAVFGPSIAGVHIGAFLGPNKSIDGRNASKHHQTRKQAKPNRQRLREPLKNHQNHETARNNQNSTARAGKYVKKLNFIPHTHTLSPSLPLSLYTPTQWGMGVHA
jgi:hypothetical protein